MSAVIFTNNDIIGMSSSIPLSVDKDNVFEDIIKSLKIGNFKTTKTYTSDFGIRTVSCNLGIGRRLHVW